MVKIVKLVLPLIVIKDSVAIGPRFFASASSSVTASSCRVVAGACRCGMFGTFTSGSPLHSST